jgi:hypothetical protein
MTEFLSSITPYLIITQAVGFIGLAMNFISYQQNANRRIVGFQILGALFWMIHFIMLGAVVEGAYTGAALNLIGLFRNVVFVCRPETPQEDGKPHWASRKAWLYLFCLMYVIAGIVTYDSPVSLIPSAAMIFGSIALYLIDPKKTRRFALACSAGWMTYNIFSFSIAGFTSEVFTITSIIIAMFKYDFKSKKEKGRKEKEKKEKNKQNT